MRRSFGRSGAVLLTTGLTVGLVASGMSAASAAPSPRISANQCAVNAPENGYVINDTTTNTKCTVNSNGTFMWASKAVAKWKKKKKKSQKVKFKASFKVVKPRGDAKQYVTYRFVRGNTVIKKRVPIKSNKRAVVNIKLPKKGTWAVVAKYKNKVVTTTIKVKKNV